MRERLQKVCKIARDALGAHHCSIFVMPEGSHDRIVLEATTSDRLIDEIGKYNYQLGEGLTGWIAQQNRPLRLQGDFTQRHLRSIDPDLKWRKKYMEEDPHGYPDFDFLGAPLLVTPEQCIGAIRCTAKKGPLELFTSDDQELLAAVGRQVAQAIRRDRLETARDRVLAEAVHHSKNAVGRIRVLLYEMDRAMRSGNITEELPN
ncbi:GAF domain-containing protein [Candidatus Poribacteria bacterium]|nr:GAF domain-containing protein [Candidatus Poribacteria bacterium]